MCKYLYLRNGNIWTGDSNQPYAESLIIGNGKVLAVGSTTKKLKGLVCKNFLRLLDSRHNAQ